MIAQPFADSPDDQARQLEGERRMLLLDGDWSSLLEDAIRAFFHADVIQVIESARDMSRNPAKFAWTACNTLYEMPPTTSVDGGTSTEAVTTDMLWAVRDTVQLWTIALGEAAVRLDWSDTEGTVVYRAVSPTALEVEADPRDPSRPVWVRETLIRPMPDGVWVWTRDTWDLRVPGAPRFAVEIWTVGTSGGGRWEYATDLFSDLASLPGGYPYWYDGTPIMPYVICHARISSRMWTPYQWLELIEATLHAGCAQTWWLANFRDASHPTRVTIDCTAPSAAHASQMSGAPSPNFLLIPPNALMSLKSDPNRNGSVSTLQATMEPMSAMNAIDAYVANALRDAGIGPVDEAPAKGVSGVAITVSRESLRRSQRHQRPAAKRSDRLILATGAKLFNSYSGSSSLLPTVPSGWQISYNGLPPTVDEVVAMTQRVTVQRQAGLLPRWRAIQMANPDLSEDQAKLWAAEIDAENLLMTPPSPGVSP